MSPPVRAYLISLSLVLGMTVSLVWGQAPTHFTLSGVTVTGLVPITSVGSGTNESPSLLCHTTNAVNTVWLFPNGSIITQVSANIAATDSFIFRTVPTSNYVLLRRGPSVRSPGGDYCCGSATNVSGRLCINLVVDCETPPSITNGSPGTPTNTALGGTVTYTCNNGYQISPGVTMATASCLATGNWETLTCLAVDCGSLNAPTNGGVTTPSGTTFMNIAIYSCTTGYTLTGDMTRTCGSDGMWTPAEPSCPPVMCGPPPSISNGSPETPTKTTFEGTVTYTCNNGYQISPGVTMATASCLATGNWQTITCSPVDCGSLNSPTNGGVTTSSGTTFMNTATYSCTTGYTLTGDMTRTCGSNGMWTLTEPSCSAVDCGSPPSISNGSPETPTRTLLGGTVTYTCNNGYQISPGITMATVSCLATGNWETVTCLVVCGTPPSISNGSPGIPTSTLLGGTLTYTCNHGYQISPGVTMATASCLATGNWETVPTCLAIRVVPSADDPPIAGQSYSLTCTVTGADSLNATISYQWTRGSTTVGTNAILTFDPLMLSDTGQYLCEVTLSSNLLSENIRAVSDMFDLEIPTVFIQLLFRGIHNCPEYRQTNANGIVQDVTNGLVEAIQGLCVCGLTSTHVSKSFLQCFSDSPEQIAFRAQLNQTTQATTEELVSYIDQWVTNPGRLIVQESLLQLNTTCSLVITDQFVSSECPTTRATGTLPSSAPPSQCDNIGAIVGGAVVVILGLALILALTAVIIAYLVLKQRRMGGVDLKTPDIPLTDRGQSIPVQTYDTVDVTYEEVDVPHPQKGSYEYSQCQAYAPTPGRGVVNVVDT